MNVLLIGGGGREHALAWKIARSPLLDRLYCAPGNAGIARHADIVALDVHDHQNIIAFCRAKEIGLVIVGPEAPLVAGIVDDLTAAGIRAFGPTAAAARLEGSKSFTKELCAEYNIPTAHFARFNNAPKAKRHVREHGVPVVVKADGLAAGKGVTVAHSLADALEAVDACFEGAFGAAGAEVVVEDFLEGDEASLFALCDGTNAVLLGTAQDHKRAFDGDTGPNTGGMGAFSPSPRMDSAMIDETMVRIIVPTLAAMHKRGTPFRGILYAGLMLNESGPQLIEYNVRFGDPECQVILPRMQSDLLEIFLSATDGDLLARPISWSPQTALSVVMASRGYPGSYEKGTVIAGVADAEKTGALIFHAGTVAENGRLLANGGRVLNVTGMGDDVGGAAAAAYRAVNVIEWPGGYFRTDIGRRAITREDKAG